MSVWRAMFWKKQSPIDLFIEETRQEAAKLKPVRNGIRLDLQPNGQLTVTMFINDEDTAWINFNKSQIDGLITKLQAARLKMK